MNIDNYQLNEDDIAIWRRFKDGESAFSIGKSLDMGRESVLKIVLLVDYQMATSKFFERELDYEGCPVATRIDVQVPTDLDELEEWLKR